MFFCLSVFSDHNSETLDQFFSNLDKGTQLSGSTFIYLQGAGKRWTNYDSPGPRLVPKLAQSKILVRAVLKLKGFPIQDETSETTVRKKFIIFVKGLSFCNKL